jgi:hypothetical protein
MDRFVKNCLVLIVLLLMIIVSKLVFSPQAVHAQRNMTYLAVRPPNPSQPQAELDKYSAQGWELAGSYAVNWNGVETAVLILRK